MILSAFIIILMAGGIIAWIAERWNPILSRWISLLALLFNLATAVLLWTEQAYLIERSHSSWLAKYEVPWIPIFGISFNLALDGLSLLMLLLTFLLGIFAVLTSWREIQYRIGFLPLQFVMGIGWHYRGFSNHGFVLVLFLLGGHAHPNVFSYCHLGTRKQDDMPPTNFLFSHKPAGFSCFSPFWDCTLFMEMNREIIPSTISNY